MSYGKRPWRCERCRKQHERCTHRSKPDNIDREADFLVRLIHGELPRLYRDCQRLQK